MIELSKLSFYKNYMDEETKKRIEEDERIRAETKIKIENQIMERKNAENVFKIITLLSIILFVTIFTTTYMGINKEVLYFFDVVLRLFLVVGLVGLFGFLMFWLSCETRQQKEHGTIAEEAKERERGSLKKELIEKKSMLKTLAILLNIILFGLFVFFSVKHSVFAPVGIGTLFSAFFYLLPIINIFSLVKNRQKKMLKKFAIFFNILFFGLIFLISAQNAISTVRGFEFDLVISFLFLLPIITILSLLKKPAKENK
jgi:hypothetical protein